MSRTHRTREVPVIEFTLEELAYLVKKSKSQVSRYVSRGMLWGNGKARTRGLRIFLDCSAVFLLAHVTESISQRKQNRRSEPAKRAQSEQLWQKAFAKLRPEQQKSLIEEEGRQLRQRTDKRNSLESHLAAKIREAISRLKSLHFRRTRKKPR